MFLEPSWVSEGLGSQVVGVCGLQQFKLLVITEPVSVMCFRRRLLFLGRYDTKPQKALPLPRIAEQLVA